MMKKLTMMVLAVLLLVGCGSKGNGNEGSEKKYRIGVVQLAEHPSLDATYNGLKDVLEAKLGKDNVTFDYKNAQGDITNANMIVSKFVSDEVDLIYAIATNAAQSAYNGTEGTDIPVVFNAVTDPVDAGIVKSLEKPENNITGVSDLSPLALQIKIIKDVLPDAKKVGILYNVGESNSPIQIELLKEAVKDMGLEIVAKGVSDQSEIPLVAKALAAEVDAFYNITDNMMVQATENIVAVADEAGIPVFATEDGKLDMGLLGAESLSYYRLGEVAGELVIDILVNNKEAGTLPVTLLNETKLYLNLEVAEKLKIDIPQAILDRLD